MLSGDCDGQIETEIAIFITRRELVICSAAAAFLVTSGCATARRGSGIDAAVDELDMLLEQIGGEDGDTLVALAEKISTDSHALLEVHRVFAVEFNREAVDRTVHDEALVKLAIDYEADRVALRNTLLRTQDELHAVVPADVWPDVLEVLNRKSLEIAPRHGVEG